MSPSIRDPRVVAALVVAALWLSLTACSSAEETADQTTSAATSAGGSERPSAGYPFDTSDTADDLLSPEHRSYEFGPDEQISWQFPTYYDDGEIDESSAVIEDGGATFGLQVGLSDDSTPRDLAEQLAEAAAGGEPMIYEIRLDDRDWVAFVNDGDALTRVSLFGTFSGGRAAGLSFTATTPLVDVPPERIAELHQAVQSIRIESAGTD